MTFRHISFNLEQTSMPESADMLEPGHGFWLMGACALGLGLWLMILSAAMLT